MANGKIRFGKQSGGQLALVIPDGISDTEVVLPESGELATKEYVDIKTLNINSLSDKPTPINTDNFVLQEVGGDLKKVSYKNLINLSPNDASVKTALNASGGAPIYACRAWVSFNGAGTVAIRASGNVSSITDNGAGSYTVNFTTAMSDANYSVSCIGENSTLMGCVIWKDATKNITASQYPIMVAQVSNSALFDSNLIQVSIFR